MMRLTSITGLTKVNESICGTDFMKTSNGEAVLLSTRPSTPLSLPQRPIKTPNLRSILGGVDISYSKQNSNSAYSGFKAQ